MKRITLTRAGYTKKAWKSIDRMDLADKIEAIANPQYPWHLCQVLLAQYPEKSISARLLGFALEDRHDAEYQRDVQALEVWTNLQREADQRRSWEGRMAWEDAEAARNNEMWANRYVPE